MSPTYLRGALSYQSKLGIENRHAPPTLPSLLCPLLPFPHATFFSYDPVLPLYDGLYSRRATAAQPTVLRQVPWENQNMHCIVTVYGCAVHIDTANELES